MFFSLSLSTVIVVPLLASSVSSVSAHPHIVRDIRDTSLVARRHHHHHIARQPNTHSFTRRSVRRQRCLERSTLPSSSLPSSPPSSSPSSSPYSPAAVATTSNDPVLDHPINVAPPPPTTTTTPAPNQPTYSAPYSPPQAPPQTSPQTPPTDTSSPSSTGSGESHFGDGTFFDVGLVRAPLVTGKSLAH
jgi:hypothetical protein